MDTSGNASEGCSELCDIITGLWPVFFRGSKLNRDIDTISP